MRQLILALAIIGLAAVPTIRAAHAATCTTSCYGSGSYQTCNTYCY